MDRCGFGCRPPVGTDAAGLVQTSPELGQKLARETQNVYDLEARKKEIDADLASQIKGANGRVSDVTTRLNNGYEMREVEGESSE